MKIVTAATNFEYSEEQESLLNRMGEFVNTSVQNLEGQALVDHIGGADILIAGSSGIKYLDGEVLSKCPNLKFISVMGVGTDFIDIKAATELSIKISTLKGANAESVAEHAWGIILNLSKRITEAHNGAKEGKNSFVNYLGIELQHKTIGVIGFGEIGSRVARIAKGFDMQILANNRSKKEVQGVQFVKLDELLQNSDVVVLSLPLTADTKNIIGTKEFDLMKQDTILINPSREGLIDRDALFDALTHKKLFGFGLESTINSSVDSKLYKFANVLVTPHNAMFTVEAEERCSDMIIDNVVKFASGEPQNLIN